VEGPSVEVKVFRVRDLVLQTIEKIPEILNESNEIVEEAEVLARHFISLNRKFEYTGALASALLLLLLNERSIQITERNLGFT